jgi:CDGSH-type Zn-finger protein
MAKPIVANNKPVAVELSAGDEYYFCTCGKSGNQPFCDGSHAGTGFVPRAFTAESDGDAYLCQCKQSANAPFCDGAHARLSDDQVGQEVELESNSSADAMPDPEPTPEEPTVAFIHQLAREGLSKLGHHGEMGAMGVPRSELPSWDSIQFIVAQLATKPLLEDTRVGTDLVVGPEAKKLVEMT